MTSLERSDLPDPHACRAAAHAASAQAGEARGRESLQVGAVRRKSFWKRREQGLIGSGSMLLFLAFWEFSVARSWVNPLFTSSPTRIARTAIDMFAEGSIWYDIQVSGYEFLVGYGAAIVIGVPLGILMGWYSRINAVFDPFVSALYATPRIALLPLVMIWFGIGLMSKIAIVFLGAIFPILVNTITGVRTVNADFVKVARSFGCSDWQMFLTVALPSSVPLLLTGLRLGLGHALVGIVVGEMYGATHGLGFLIATSGARFQTDKVMVGIILIASAGVALTALLRLIERRFERWRPSVGR
jgi:ABC-type nitrate/sulfonate/bicarbonate transport system permease component